MSRIVFLNYILLFYPFSFKLSVLSFLYPYWVNKNRLAFTGAKNEKEFRLRDSPEFSMHQKKKPGQKLEKFWLSFSHSSLFIL
jgi:hypothetical protein